MSKHASNFASETDTVSESEASTAPSSLMTVVRSPNTQLPQLGTETPTSDHEGGLVSKLTNSGFDQLSRQSEKPKCVKKSSKKVLSFLMFFKIS